MASPAKVGAEDAAPHASAVGGSSSPAGTVDMDGVGKGKPRADGERPVFKLSVQLIDTYKHINKVYYERKKKREEEHKARAGSRSGANNNGYDDEHYDYILHHDEVINDRYEVQGRLGKGSFGQVVKCKDRETGHEIALKIIKSKRPFTVQAKTEIKLLETLSTHDPEDEFRTVRMLGKFTFRGHQCIVFELLSCNLYELLRNTNFRGISLNLTRKLARQVLKTLHFLKTLPDPIIHCDLKPENMMLCHPRRSAVKVIDFGSACTHHDRMYSYIQSRFYRSPEVMMGLPYGTPIDMWSLGCILAEMHTGEPLFSGKDTHDQMRRIVAMLGMPPQPMVDKAPEKNRDVLFVQEGGSGWGFKHKDGQAASSSKGEGEGEKRRRLEDVLGVNSGGPGGRRKGEAGHTPHHYGLFHNLLSRMLTFDVEQRLTPMQALHHAFFVDDVEGGDAAAAAAAAAATAAAATEAAAAAAAQAITDAAAAAAAAQAIADAAMSSAILTLIKRAPATLAGSRRVARKAARSRDNGLVIVADGSMNVNNSVVETKTRRRDTRAAEHARRSAPRRDARGATNRRATHMTRRDLNGAPNPRRNASS